jgi:D-alanine-D-alanine ligase
MSNTIAVAYGAVPPEAPADEQDVLVEVEAVSTALRSLGYRPIPYPLSADLTDVLALRERTGAELVFNLVESLSGISALMHVPLLVFDRLGIAYTGAGAHALYVTSNKIMTKEICRRCGMPTPPWQSLLRTRSGEADRFELGAPGVEPPWILKPVCEEASVDLDDNSVFHEPEALAQVLRALPPRERRGRFVERYVDGRELNVSILATENGPLVLPPAETLFVEYPARKPRIVGYDAKWDPSSFAFSHTPRSFDFGQEDRDMLASVTEICYRCWREFSLNGYARVDFRVDAEGNPWVLEVNANPCISPDSGFVAAALRAVESYDTIVEFIVADALRKGAWGRCSERRRKR